MKLLLLGATGMLGRDVTTVAADLGWTVHCPTRQQLDLTRPGQLLRFLETHPTDTVINAAAATAVDATEHAPATAFAVNATGVAHLSAACAARDLPLVHISTDYVFSGPAPHTPDGRRRGWLPGDPTTPANMYGATKLAGEWAATAAGGPVHMVRVSWLAGAHGTSFVSTMLHLGQQIRDGGRPGPLQVVGDQWGRLTTTRPLAERLCALATQDRYRTHHITHTGPAVTWYDLAAATFAAAGWDIPLQRCSSDEFPRPAPRPTWSVLDDPDLPIEPLGHWQDALGPLVHQLAGGPTHPSEDGAR